MPAAREQIGLFVHFVAVGYVIISRVVLPTLLSPCWFNKEM